jgi:hypothetical protein
MCITYSDCVSVAFGIQHAMRVRCILLWPVWLYTVFPHNRMNGMIFENKVLNIRCVFRVSLQLLSETFPILTRTGRGIIINVHRSSCQLPITRVTF